MFYCEEILSEIKKTIEMKEAKWLIKNSWIIDEISKLIHKLNFLVIIKNLLDQQAVKQAEKINSIAEAIVGMKIELDEYLQKLNP